MTLVRKKTSKNNVQNTEKREQIKPNSNNRTAELAATLPVPLLHPYECPYGNNPHSFFRDPVFEFEWEYAIQLSGRYGLPVFGP